MKKILFLLMLFAQIANAADKTNVFQTIRFKNLNTVDIILEVDDDAKTCGLKKAELLRSANAMLNQSRVVKVDSNAEDYVALNITTLPTSYDEETTPSCLFVTQIELNRLINFKDKKIYASLWENSLLNYAQSSEKARDESKTESMSTLKGEVRGEGAGKAKTERSEKSISNERLIESTIQKLLSSFLNEVQTANP